MTGSKSLWLRLMSAVFCFAVAACNSSGGQQDSGSGSDRGRSDGRSPGSEAASSKKALWIDAVFGLQLHDKLVTNCLYGSCTAEPKGVDGKIGIKRTGQGDNYVKIASVTLDGTTLSTVEGLLGTQYDPGVVTPSGAAGQTLTIKATDGADSSTLALPCPADVQITSPTDNTAVGPGDKIDITWTGTVSGEAAFGSFGLLAPSVQLRTYDPATSKAQGCNQCPNAFLKVNDGMSVTVKTSATLTVPTGTAAGYLLELTSYGPVQKPADGEGHCAFTRRIILKAK